LIVFPFLKFDIEEALFSKFVCPLKGRHSKFVTVLLKRKKNRQKINLFKLKKVLFYTSVFTAFCFHYCMKNKKNICFLLKKSFMAPSFKIPVCVWFQDLLFLTCSHPENKGRLADMEEWPEWILEIMISNYEVIN
jgi:hypothetical protein